MALSNVPEVLELFRKFDEREQADVDALIAGMPSVQAYVEQNRSLWLEQRPVHQPSPLTPA